MRESSRALSSAVHHKFVSVLKLRKPIGCPRLSVVILRSTEMCGDFIFISSIENYDHRALIFSTRQQNSQSKDAEYLPYSSRGKFTNAPGVSSTTLQTVYVKMLLATDFRHQPHHPLTKQRRTRSVRVADSSVVDVICLPVRFRP